MTKEEIENRIEELENEIKYENNKMKCCGSSKRDWAYIEELEEELGELEELIDEM